MKDQTGSLRHVIEIHCQLIQHLRSGWAVIRALVAVHLLVAMTFVQSACRTELGGDKPFPGGDVDVEAFSALNDSLDFFDAGYGASLLLDDDRGLAGSIAFRANDEGANRLMLLEFDASGSSLKLDIRPLFNNVGDILVMRRFAGNGRRVIAGAFLQPAGTPYVGLMVEGGSGWEDIIIDSSDANGLHVDMVIDGNDVVHVAYISQDARTLRYFQWQDGVVITQPSGLVIVDSGLEPGESGTSGSIDGAVSIALTSDNIPVISYYDGRNGRLRVAHQRSEDLTWAIHIVGGTLLGRVLTVNESGLATVSQPFIPRKSQMTVYKDLVPLPDSAYVVDSTTQLRILDYDANAEYTLDSVLPVSLDYGTWSRLRLSDTGTVSLSFFDKRGGRMMYAVNSDIINSQRWAIDVVDQQGIVGGAHDLVLLPFFDEAGIRRSDTPVIAYQDIGNSDLLLAFRAEDGWRRTRLHAAGLTGFGPSMAATADNNVVLAYREHRPDERFSANLQLTRTLPLGF